MSFTLLPSRPYEDQETSCSVARRVTVLRWPRGGQGPDHGWCLLAEPQRRRKAALCPGVDGRVVTDEHDEW